MGNSNNFFLFVTAVAELFGSGIWWGVIYESFIRVLDWNFRVYTMAHMVQIFRELY